MKHDILKHLQAVELSILHNLHSFCESNSVKYSLYAGTALGAVRHAGFIPWDDDIDIIMTRDEFEKFCKAWSQNPLEGYYFQDSMHYLTGSICHAKIRKNNTVFLSEGDEDNSVHNGIWIDIFVLDKIKPDLISKLQMWWNGFLRVVLSRANSTNATDSRKKKLLKVLNQFLSLKARKKLYEHASRDIAKVSKEVQSYNWVDLCCFSCFRILFPKEMTESYISIPFEDKEFMIFEDYHTMLELEYGDYMQLPPEDERICKHKPSVLKFGDENNLE